MLVLAQGVLKYAKTEEQYESQVLCASDWNIPNCGSCGQFKNKKKIVCETSVTVGPRPSALPTPLQSLLNPYRP